MSQLIGRLFNRAGISFRRHDLRRTFASLVREVSGDEFLAMRLIRDRIPGQNDRYISFPMVRLREALESYSPLKLIKKAPALPELGLLVETGESRTPRPREAAQNILQA